MPTDVKVPADIQRKRRARANYGQNAAGNWVRKRSWRSSDYTEEGHFREFESEEAFLRFEEDRYQQGKRQATCEKKPRGTVPKEQLALEDPSPSPLCPHVIPIRSIRQFLICLHAGIISVIIASEDLS